MKRPMRYVLLIDDNVHHVELLTEVLDKYFQPVVVHAIDAIDEALRMINEVSYDLVISESVVKDVSLLKSMPKISAKNLPVIVISGQGDESMAVKLSKVGVADYLVKTKQTLDDLPKIIAKHIKNRKKTENANVLEYAPTRISFKEELDKLAQDVLFIVSQRGSVRIEHFERMLESVSKLKKMAEKI